MRRQRSEKLSRKQAVFHSLQPKARSPMRSRGWDKGVGLPSFSWGPGISCGRRILRNPRSGNGGDSLVNPTGSLHLPLEIPISPWSGPGGAGRIRPPRIHGWEADKPGSAIPSVTAA